MKRITSIVVSAFAVFAMLFVPVALVSESVSAAPKDEICKGINNNSTGKCDTTGDNNFGEFVKRIINILLFVIGAIAVLMIVIGGLRYVISGGDGAQTKAAKDTILYAVIGLVIALMAYAIINFVVVNVV